MFKSAFLVLAFFGATVGLAMADGITYDITVNTSSISGTVGSLDFQFNPGPLGTQTADLQILNFASDGILGTSVLTGDVAGALPGTSSFDNGGALNDYFTGFTYGSTLSFMVNLFGPAVTAPNGTSTSGSTFALSMFSDPGGTVPVLTTDTVNGFALTVNVNLDGTTTVTNFSPELTASVAPVPEPSTLLLLGSGLASLRLFQRKKQRNIRSKSKETCAAATMSGHAR